MDVPKNFEELKQTALVISGPIRVFWDIYRREDVFTPKVGIKYEKCYYTNGGVICFVHKKIWYVIPYMKKVEELLKQQGFFYIPMYVPFSRGEEPIEQKEKWNELQSMVKEQIELDFVKECQAYANKHFYEKIDSKLLELCMQVPAEGLDVENNGKINTYLPQLNTTSLLDEYYAKKIGKYNVQGGVCVFVYIDGKTYVTRNWLVVKALVSAGFKRANLDIPLAGK